MDLVTQNLLTTFKSEESLPDDIEDSVCFEHFANFCAVSSSYGEEFDIADIHTGGANDLAIDGLAVIVNGALVIDLEEIEDLCAANNYLEVEFLFCQAKSGTNFSGAEISSQFFGIKDLFSTSPALPRNPIIAERETLIRAIYEKSSFFKRRIPAVSIYYVTAGKWQDDEQLVARIEREKEGLLELNIFSEVAFKPVDARELQRMYSRAKNKLTTTIELSHKVTLPNLPDIQESYLGFLPVQEYLKLITDESGNILKGIFYDNVRDFQGENPVNREIDETLKTPDQQLFVLLNNGVTIVADSITKTGDVFNIEDYQIVNGCQTSHVLFQNRAVLERPIQVPIKLIVSQNSEVKNKIIKATNRQTPVKPEELTALTDFQKTLEDYYSAVTGDCQLYYERRSQQYRTSNIEKIRIVNISGQIRSFSSMFLGLPHQASRYYGTLLKTIESKIFVPNHPPIAYYASALALYRFESFTRKVFLDPKFRPFKYHILAIVRIIIAGESPTAMTSNIFERYCQTIVDNLKDEAKCLLSLVEAIALLDKSLDGDYGRDKAKDASLSEAALANRNS